MGNVLGGNEFDDEADKYNRRNVLFYQNKIRSRPWPGKKIERMLEWRGDYDKLEYNHSYIQWLFPIKEGSGTNWSAQGLTDEEKQMISEDDEARQRFLLAYGMMLDFYGIYLISDIDGKVERANHWPERANHLNRSKHNYRRITRIIKALGEFGFDQFQPRLVMFMIEEAVVHRTIPNIIHGALNFWIESIIDDDERDEVRRRFLELTTNGPSGLLDNLYSGESERRDLEGEEQHNNDINLDASDIDKQLKGHDRTAGAIDGYESNGNDDITPKKDVHNSNYGATNVLSQVSEITKPNENQTQLQNPDAHPSEINAIGLKDGNCELDGGCLIAGDNNVHENVTMESGLKVQTVKADTPNHDTH